MTQQLTERERKILSVVQLNARATAQELARRSRTRVHTIHYALKRLTERKVIRPFTVVNPHILGLTDYCVFLRTEGATSGTRASIVRTCIAENVGYLAELSGKYQWSFSLFGSSVLPVQRLLANLSKALPGVGLVSSFAIRTEWTLLGTKFTKSTGSESPSIRRRLSGTTLTLDDTDSRILNLLLLRPLDSYLALSKSLSVSEGTVRRRVAKLIDDQVILGFAYYIDTAPLGWVSCRALITCRYNDEKFYSELFRFAAAHPLIYEFVRCLGSWDYELNFEVDSMHKAGDFIQELYDRFGARIHSAELITKIKTHSTHLHQIL